MRFIISAGLRNIHAAAAKNRRREFFEAIAMKAMARIAGHAQIVA